MSEEATITVSVSRKVNLGNYESADYFVSLSGLKAGTTAAEMEPLLETGRVAWERVRAALVAQMKQGAPK